MTKITLPDSIAKQPAAPVAPVPTAPVPTAPVPTGTIDLTPTWTGLLPAFIALLQNGSPEGQKVAREELERMAALADSAKRMAARADKAETERDVLSALGMAGQNTGGR